MPTIIPNEYGKAVEIDLIREVFDAEEGQIEQYYGRIGNGKTYNATADIWEDLRRGLSVYANWQVEWPGYDERDSFGRLLFNFLTFSKRFYRFKQENLHFYSFDDDWAKKQSENITLPNGDVQIVHPYKDFMDWFASRTDCKIYADEGHVLFDSYQTTKFSMKKRTAILHTRHFNRTIAIISQRPTAVHVSARANVNVFYKCEKLMSWPFLIFRRTEFQDMVGETVDDTKPISKKWYFASKRILQSYNTKYLRGGIPRSQNVYVDAFDLTFEERFRALVFAALRAMGFGLFFPSLKRQKEEPAPQARAVEIENVPAQTREDFREQLSLSIKKTKERKARERAKYFRELAIAKKKPKEEEPPSLFGEDVPS
jgi:hypothetical protein